jgi:hypothetical protein
VTAQDYPAMLVTGGLHDTRTPYWLPAKWVAMLRDLKTDGNPLLLQTEMTAGHFGASGFDDYSRQVALMNAFLLQELGMADVRPDQAAAAISAPHAARRSSEPLRSVPPPLRRQPRHSTSAGRRVSPRTAQARAAVRRWPEDHMLDSRHREGARGRAGT